MMLKCSGNAGLLSTFAFFYFFIFFHDQRRSLGLVSMYQRGKKNVKYSHPVMSLS